MLTESPVAQDIRYLTKAFFSELLAIERASFTYPWTRKMLMEAMMVKTTNGFVSLIDKRVAGYMIVDFRDTEIEIKNLAVDPIWRRHGVAAALVTMLKEHSLSKRRGKICAAAADNNLPAHLFFKAQGFVALGVSRGHFAATPTLEDPEPECSDAYRVRVYCGGKWSWVHYD